VGAPTDRGGEPGARRSRRGGRLLADGLLFGCGLLLFVGLDPALRDRGVPLILRWPLWAFVASIWLLPFVVLRAASRSNRYDDIRLSRPVVIATCCALSAGGALVLVRATRPPLPLVGSVAGICVVAIGVWLAVFAQARAVRRVPVQRALRVDSAANADALVAACRHELDGPLSEDERAACELNLARALVTLCRQADRDDTLAEAAAILDRARQSTSPEHRFAAAQELVEAMTVKAERSGDLDGYEASLQWALDAGTHAQLAAAEGPSRARGYRARSLVRLAERAEHDARAEHAERLRVRARQELELALDLTAASSRLHAQHVFVLAALQAGDPRHTDVDAAISTCRRALRRLRGMDWELRAPGYLALADLLAKRAVLAPDGGLGGFLSSLWPGRPDGVVVDYFWPRRSTHDLSRAIMICVRLSLRDELAPQVVRRIPELTHLGRMSHRMGPGIRPVGWLYERAFAAQAGLAPGNAVDLAAQWARWAAMRGDVERAAEAHWSWITAVVAASRRRAFLEDKELALSGIQGRIAEAGLWLLSADRPRDSAVALELGRAVLLTERMQRDRGDLPHRLADAGRDDLRRRWNEARDRIQESDRAGFHPGPERPTRAAPHATGFGSETFAALAQYEQLLREIGELPGFQDVATTLGYDDLRAAACDGPIVYVCAAAERGFALIVDREPEPRVVALPWLTAGAGERQALRLAGLESAHDIADEIEQQRPWLWKTIMEPIAACLEPGSLVTLIATGAIGQLPLHVACTAPATDGVWRDLTDGIVFRFAPNARVLMLAQETARAFEGELPRVLTVAVPDAPGAPPLPFARAESDAVLRLFGEPRAERAQPASVAAVLGALDRCPIWHFACHGEHDPDDPLRSHLVLDGGEPLTLR
jgi:hypothetical protein